MNANRARSMLAAALICGGLLGGAASAPAATSVDIRIGIPPPLPREEFVPRQRHGRIWIAGFWIWNRGAYEWVPGHWERVRRGYRYVPARWERFGEEWVFRPGHWEAVGRPVVTVQPPPPPVYVERPAEPPAVPPTTQPTTPQSGMWYYCRDPAGYYPTVPKCPGGWQPVAPKP